MMGRGMGRVRATLAWLSFIGACLLPVPAGAQGKFAVELRVQGNASVLQNARSSFAKELGALPDVEVVDSLADWELLVLAADMRNEATRLGIVVGATLLEVVDGEDLAAADPQISSELHDFLEERPLGVYKNMWVYYGGPDDMRAIARQVVAEVDASAFQPCRTLVTSSSRTVSTAGDPTCHRSGSSPRTGRSAALTSLPRDGLPDTRAHGRRVASR